jgi:hypothetical protein
MAGIETLLGTEALDPCSFSPDERGLGEMATMSDARCPMCNGVIVFNDYHILSVRPGAAAEPSEMVVTEGGQTIHRCPVPPALRSLGDPSPQRLRSL